jgi:hypothetical protein
MPRAINRTAWYVSAPAMTFAAAKRPAATTNRQPESTPVATSRIGQPMTATGMAIFHHRPNANPARSSVGITPLAWAHAFIESSAMWSYISRTSAP